MIKSRQAALLSLLSFLPFLPMAHGQAAPAAVAVAGAPYHGFQLPKVKGTLQYAVSASETLITGGYGSGSSSVTGSTNLSGDVAYLSPSLTHPLSLIYSGGFLGGTSGQPISTFQNLALSQVLLTKSWNFIVSDSVSYLPNAPTTGLSGIAGVGDLGIAPVQVGPGVGQGVLTTNSARVSNVTLGSVERRLTGKTSLHASGSLLLQRFTDGGSNSLLNGGSNGTSNGVPSSLAYGGLDSNQVTASAGASHLINTRNSYGADYTYSRYTYANNLFGFTTQGVNAEYFRQWTRRLNTSISLGPQRTSSSTAGVPSSVNLAASLGLNYTGEVSSASAGYFRGVNNGSGVVQGARTDSLNAGYRRMYGRSWNVALTAAYNRTHSLPGLSLLPISTQSVVAGVQVSRALSRSFFAYASYTAQKQAVQGSAATFGVFNGLSQVIGLGLTYSPASIHFGRL